jgi:bacterioferritin-associated ferredoxin
MYICLCNGVTECDIRTCAQQGACSLRDLEHGLGVGMGCGRCRHAAAELLREHQRPAPLAASGAPA